MRLDNRPRLELGPGSALGTHPGTGIHGGHVGLLHKRRQNALSSGETNRLGIAWTLVIEPEVFFLDEPTANLDPENYDIIEEIIFSMKSARKSTIIVVTHDPAQARRLGDHPLVMENGRIAPL
jgi:tungstate transport system ATP-binding protein